MVEKENLLIGISYGIHKEKKNIAVSLDDIEINLSETLRNFNNLSLTLSPVLKRLLINIFMFYWIIMRVAHKVADY